MRSIFWEAALFSPTFPGPCILIITCCLRIHPFQAVYPNMDFVTSADAFFGSVREEYVDYQQSGFFVKSSRESLYVYQIETPRRTYTGLIGCADADDYRANNIRRHEHTLSEKEQQQMHLLIKRKAQVKPVLLTHAPVGAMDDFLRQFVRRDAPFLDIPLAKEGVVHRFWEIKDGPDIDRIQQWFEGSVPHSYIADGHHRTSTLALMDERLTRKDYQGEFDKILCAFFPVDELEILDFNRLLDNLNGRSLTTFLVELSRYFEMRKLDGPTRPERAHELTMLLGEEWFGLRWRSRWLEAAGSPADTLDARLLNRHILCDVLGIDDIRTDPRVRYVGGPAGPEGLLREAQRYDSAVGFCLYPVDAQDFMRIADAGDTLPPKSTWFEPRMKNGMLVKEF